MCSNNEEGAGRSRPKSLAPLQPEKSTPGGFRNIALHFPILRQQQSRLQTTSMLALLDFGPICIPIHEYDINKKH